MDSHKETQALDLASDQKRKSTYATKVATPSKKINLNLEDGQLSEVQQPAHQDLPNEATLSAEVQELERQVPTASNRGNRLELIAYANSWRIRRDLRSAFKLARLRIRVLKNSSKYMLLPSHAPCAMRSPRP